MRLRAAQIIAPDTLSPDMTAVTVAVWTDAAQGHHANTIAEAVTMACRTWRELRYYRPADLNCACQDIEAERIRNANLGLIQPPEGLDAAAYAEWQTMLTLAIADGATVEQAIDVAAHVASASQVSAQASGHPSLDQTHP